jgi:hypothetical protein
MKSTKTAQSTQSTQSTQSIRRDAQNLDGRYGKIGISAVAAAMRYQGDTKDPAHVPTDRQADRWLNDMVPEFAA